AHDESSSEVRILRDEEWRLMLGMSRIARISHCLCDERNWRETHSGERRYDKRAQRTQLQHPSVDSHLASSAVRYLPVTNAQTGQLGATAKSANLGQTYFRRLSLHPSPVLDLG